jgi:tetratricopeptide (TPR) repeat protein
MVLSLYGSDSSQWDLASVLKPDPEDKHVDSREMERFARELGMEAQVRVGGTLADLKALLCAGFPVIAPTWYVRDPLDQLGHYRVLVGYDDPADQFITYDSLHGPDVPIGYGEFDELWRVYNRLYLLVYPKEKVDAVNEVLGSDADGAAMCGQALDHALREVSQPPTNYGAYASSTDWETFSWFNVGSSLTCLGRYAEASRAFDEARRLGLPRRMLWYQSAPYESYYGAGLFDEIIELANTTLLTAGNLEESYYWRGKARLALGDEQGAKVDFSAALRYHDAWPPAVSELAALALQ